MESAKGIFILKQLIEILKSNTIFVSICSSGTQSTRTDQEAKKKKRRSLITVEASLLDSLDSDFVPGSDFDPQSSSFNPKELQPRPVVKKAKRRVITVT